MQSQLTSGTHKDSATSIALRRVLYPLPPANSHAIKTMASSETQDSTPHLPPELLLYLFSHFVPPTDVLLKCARVSRAWRDSAVDASVWLVKLGAERAVPAGTAGSARAKLAWLAGDATFELPPVETASRTTTPFLSLYSPTDASFDDVARFADECRASIAPSLVRPVPPADPLHAFRAISLLSSLAPLLDAKLSLEPVRASSADHPTQDIEATLDGLGRTFWSSTGTPPALLSSPRDAAEHLLYGLPQCIVRRVEITPFQAVFQRGAPIYSPISVRIALLSDPPSHQTSPSSPEQLDLLYLSPPHLVPLAAVPFTIDLPPLFLPARGIAIFCIGKRTAQPTDELFYTVFQSVRAFGVELEGMQVDGGWFGDRGTIEETTTGPAVATHTANSILESAILHRADVAKIEELLARNESEALSTLILSRPPSDPLRGPAVLQLLLQKSQSLESANNARNARILAARERILASGNSSEATDLFSTPTPAKSHLRALRRHIFRLSSIALSQPFVLHGDHNREPHLSHPESIWLAAECTRSGSFDPVVTALRRGFFPLSVEIGWVLLRAGQVDLALLVFGRLEAVDAVLLCLLESGAWGHAARFIRSLDGEAGMEAALRMVRGVCEDLVRVERGEKRGWGAQWDQPLAEPQLGELEFLALREDEWPSRTPRTKGAAWGVAAAVIREFPGSKVQVLGMLSLPEHAAGFLSHATVRNTAAFLRIVADLLDSGSPLEEALERAQVAVERNGGGEMGLEAEAWDGIEVVEGEVVSDAESDEQVGMWDSEDEEEGWE